MTNADDTLTQTLRAAVADRFAQSVAELSELVKIPSVSWPAFDPKHVEASAAAVAEHVRSLGIFENVRVERVAIDDETTGAPAILAKRPARNGKPTVLLYAHHDVQPWGDEALWNSPPFEPTLRDGRLYGRGASDDKAGVMTHIAAIRALLAVDADPDLGIALFIEGEEEFGSRSFSNFLERHAAELEADVIVVADSDNWSTEIPSLTVALRGNVTFKLTVRTLEHASHSGMYGGAVPDAMLATVKLLSTLWNEDGSAAVPGLTTHDARTPEGDETALREEAGLLEGVSLVGEGPVLERLWFRPAITVTGIDAPSVAKASNTILPEVSVRISTRIAPGQSSAAAFAAIEQHLHANAAFGSHLSITDVDQGDPFLVDTSAWAVDEAKRAMTDAWGNEAVEAGIGGSIPFISELVEKFPKAQILVTGVEDPGTMAHSPNESQHLGVFEKAILSEALLLARLNERESAE
ncbi:dipeptidase [Humidisolicoccus flavus]|uniref:dipeptidase n=1 Tax=Humidisolicoccus flavus TaxID=3111414 RepID=UPI00324E0F2C